MSQGERRIRRAQRSRWLGRAVAASSLVCAPAPAYAEDMSYGGGLFFGYRFGASAGFEFGFEAFTTFLAVGGEPGSSAARSGIGPLIRLGLLGSEPPQPRLILALHGGGELARDGFALSGELGVAYGAGTGIGLHTGVLSELAYFNAGFNYELGLQQGWVGAGARVLPTYRAPSTELERDMFGVPGRPLRTDDGLLQLPVAAAQSGTRMRGPRARGAIEPVGLAFERDAALEAASVPAFLQLASELAAARAPASLVRRALRAAADERLHTALTARLAERHLGRPVVVRPPEVARRRPLARDANTVRLAVES
jgi:hypothetical protein